MDGCAHKLRAYTSASPRRDPRACACPRLQRTHTHSWTARSHEFDSLFKKYDANGDGKFDKQEFGQICYSLGQYFSPAELDAAFTLIDADGSGYIEKEEFMNFWRSDNRFARVRLNSEQMLKLQNLSEFFQYFDDDGNGSLSHAEFEAMVEHMKSTGLDMSKHNFTVQSVDKNNDGAVRFNEFLAMMIDIGALDSVGAFRPVHG